MTELPPDSPRQSLAKRFLNDVRTAYLDQQRPTFDAVAIVQIAQNWNLRAEFISELVKINDEDLRRLIVEYLEEVANSLADVSSRTNAATELLDRAGFPVGTMIAGAGVASIVTHGLAIVPLILMGFGFLCIAGIAAGRHILRRQDLEVGSAARDVRALAVRLRSLK
jgi:hypothetical protein